MKEMIEFRKERMNRIKKSNWMNEWEKTKLNERKKKKEKGENKDQI